MTPEKADLMNRISNHIRERLQAGMFLNPHELLSLKMEINNFLKEGIYEGIIETAPSIHIVPDPTDFQCALILEDEEYQEYREAHPDLASRY